jgi:hypothetical protein
MLLQYDGLDAFSFDSWEEERDYWDHLHPQMDAHDDLFDHAGLPLQDAMLENVLASQKQQCRFSHEICTNFVASCYFDFVKRPEIEDLERVMDTYACLGFPGAVGSIDCTHLWWMMCLETLPKSL